MVGKKLKDKINDLLKLELLTILCYLTPIPYVPYSRCFPVLYVDKYFQKELAAFLKGKPRNFQKLSSVN